MERKILRNTLQDHTRNLELKKKSHIKGSLISSTRNYVFSGSGQRMDDNRWAHASTIWDPRSGEKRSGRSASR